MHLDSADQLISLARRIDDAHLAPGLTEHEVAALETGYGFRYPSDLKAFLMAGLPVGKRWPDWRAAVSDDTPAASALREALSWPLDGMLFDIEHNTFWDPDWGQRPESLAAAQAIAAAAVRAAPVLIPIYGHRYMPSEPQSAGNPVFSVYQTDIIVYGRDLECYLKAEAGGWSEHLCRDERHIRCWTRWMHTEWST